MTESTYTTLRRYPRARVSFDADVSVGGRTIRMDDCLTILGAGGAFLELGENYGIGTVVGLRFRIAELGDIACQAIVRNAVEGQGVGVEFLDIEPSDQERIKAFVEKQLATQR